MNIRGGGRTADENGVMVPSQNQNEKKGGFASTFSSTSDARLPVAVIAGMSYSDIYTLVSMLH